MATIDGLFDDLCAAMPDEDSEAAICDESGELVAGAALPAGIISKALQAFNKRDLKAERRHEPAPIGTPDGRPELKLKQKLPPATKTATGSTPPPKAAPKPAQVVEKLADRPVRASKLRK